MPLYPPCHLMVLSVLVIYPDITIFSVILRQYRYIWSLDITIPRYNKRIPLLPWHIVILGFHSSLWAFQGGFLVLISLSIFLQWNSLQGDCLLSELSHLLRPNLSCCLISACFQWLWALLTQRKKKTEVCKLHWTNSDSTLRPHRQLPAHHPSRRQVQWHQLSSLFLA